MSREPSLSPTHPEPDVSALPDPAVPASVAVWPSSSRRRPSRSPPARAARRPRRRRAAEADGVPACRRRPRARPPSVAPSPSPAFPVSLTDDDGTTVQLAEEPDKIVSLTPAETEVLYALGAGDKVVGKVEDVANFPPEAEAVPVVGTFSGVDVEKIVALGTDLVIAGGNGGTQPDAIDKLRELKIPVLVMYAPDVDGVYKDIELTGDAVGEPDKADDLVASMKSGFDQVASATAGSPKPRVFYETGDQPSIFGIADKSVVRADDRARRRDADHDRQHDELGNADREARHGRPGGDHPRRLGLRRHRRRREEAGRLGRDHRGQERRDQGDRRHPRHPARAAAGRRARPLAAAIHPELNLPAPSPAASGG